MHGLLASFAKMPELELEPKEAEKLAEGIQGVARHYITLPAGVTADWINLFMALGIIYGPRIFAIQMRMNASKARPAPTVAYDNVTAFTQ